MAKTNGGTATKTPVVPNFKDVQKKAVEAAAAALKGGKQEPLKVPANANKSGPDKNGTHYSRWSERLTVSQAYRTVATSGLMDIVVIGKIRQSKDNNGEKVFSHFYLNLDDEISEGHESMNDRTYGALGTLLVATGFMPAGSVIKGSLLDKMFPMKGAPGTSSPLVGKSVVGNICQQYKQAVDLKTKKKLVDDEGEPLMEKRDAAESFLPDAPAEAEEEGEGEEE